MKPLLEKALWYQRRLASMSTSEALYRLEEAIKRYQDKAATLPTPQDYGPFTVSSKLHEKLDAASISNELLTSWQKIYDDAKKGEFQFLNQPWPPCAKNKRWHLDPVTEKFWPHDLYSFDINYRHNSDMGDVKYVWELNRLQYLQPIAALAFKKRDPEMGRFCLNEIESWIDSNPPYRGINWLSGIELALRTISILVVVSLVGEYLETAQRAKIWNTLEIHGRWLARYPSLYSSANNHRVAEGAGLFFIGCLCPQLPEAAWWKETGWSILCDNVDKQIRPDGVGAEQAVSYGAFVLELFALSAFLAQTHGVKVPQRYRQRMARGGEFLRWITDTKGNQPHIGDDDNGCVIGLHDANYVSSVLGCLNAEQPQSSHLRQLLLGPTVTLTPAPLGVKCFEYGGYTIGRHYINGRDIMLAFDHGNLGHLSIAAHGHADALSVWLHIDGQPVFVDAGTYLYHSGGAERDAFRGTAAHNTLCLEHTNSSTISGAFNWSHKANVRIVDKQLSDSNWFVEAEHDGYIQKYETLHRRRVEFSSETGAVITDYISGGEKHYAEIGYLLHPDLTIQNDDGKITIKKAEDIFARLHYEGPLEIKIRTDASYSPSFGKKQQTTRLVFTGNLAPNEKSKLRILFGTA